MLVYPCARSLGRGLHDAVTSSDPGGDTYISSVLPPYYLRGVLSVGRSHIAVQSPCLLFGRRQRRKVSLFALSPMKSFLRLDLRFHTF